jgi:mycothiol system anti-sigma-R factor
MPCENVKANLDAYVSGETPARTGLEIKDHLAECWTCAGLYATHQRLRRVLRRAVKKDSVPSGLSDRIREQIRRSIPRA